MKHVTFPEYFGHFEKRFAIGGTAALGLGAPALHFLTSRPDSFGAYVLAGALTVVSLVLGHEMGKYVGTIIDEYKNVKG